MKKRFFLVAALSSTIAITSALPAAAWRATEFTLRDVRTNTRQTRDEVRELRNDVRSQSRLLMDALRMQTGEQSSYADKQIEAFKRIQDAGQQNDTDRVRQQIRAKAESGEFDPNPDACLLVDLFGAGGAGAGSGSAGIGAQGTVVVQGAMAERAEIGAMGAASATREMANKEVIIDGHDATKRVSTFLEEPSVDMNDPQMKQAAQDFLLKLMDSSPMVPVPASELNRSEGVAKKAAQETRMNRDSIVAENWAMVNNMSSTVLDGAPLQAWAEGTPYNREIGDKASELQAIDVMTVRHYAPSSDEASKSVQVGVTLQKLHHLTSLMARMQYMQLELDRRSLMTQSAMLAKMIEDDGK